MRLYVLVFLSVLLVPLAAEALTTFDFNDIPPFSALLPITGEIVTTDYRCGTNDFCTDFQLEGLYFNGSGAPEGTLATTVDGIDGTFWREGVGLSMISLEHFVGDIRPGDDILLDSGNTSAGDYGAFLADFSAELLFAQVDVRRPTVVPTDLGSVPLVLEASQIAFLELWTDPGATGTLLAREEIFGVGESQFGEFVTLALIAPSGTSFRSIKFGLGVDTPGCESGCLNMDLGGQQRQADNIVIQAVPEPTAPLLFGAGMLVVGRALRRRAA